MEAPRCRQKEYRGGEIEPDGDVGEGRGGDSGAVVETGDVGFGIQRLGFRVLGLESRVWDSASGIQRLGSGDWRFVIQHLGFRVKGLGFSV